ncbi:hypothetical protein [Vreelandella populi]|uniref:hypothetical protein n=1 Tax=Vreelandella populi TaxID=2498858 RepID=UPI000F8D4D6B|nr:hypothetical protein [Halomonas populi]RUR52702.1 hypothetical protein ELY40_11670 [Halomonas populi]
MATTRLQDAFIPDVYGLYTVNNTPELTDFVQSGVAVTNEAITNMMSAGGATLTLPFWNDLNSESEPNYSNDDPDDFASPDKITSGEQTARVAFLNNGWASADLVAELAGDNPNQRIASRVDAYWSRQFQKRVIAASVGLYNSNVANNDGDMVFDASTGGDTTAQVFSGEAFIDAAYTMGDQVGQLRVLAVHSMVAARMAKNGLIETIRDADGRVLYRAYMDYRVVIDDSMPTFGSGADRTYLSILFGGGQFYYGNGNPLVPEEVERTPRAGHGGGVETLWSRKTWLVHPRGYKFTGAQLTGNGETDDGVPIKNASWADLNAAANWERVFDRKQVAMSFLVTK